MYRAKGQIEAAYETYCADVISIRYELLIWTFFGRDGKKSWRALPSIKISVFRFYLGEGQFIKIDVFDSTSYRITKTVNSAQCWKSRWTMHFYYGETSDNFSNGIAIGSKPIQFQFVQVSTVFKRNKLALLP